MTDLTICRRVAARNTGRRQAEVQTVPVALSGPTLALGAFVDCIIDVDDSSGTRIVRLAGRLAEAQVPDLLTVCAEQAHVRELNLRDLVSVDAVGLSVLQRLRARGVTLVETSTYLQLKLDAVARSATAR